MHKVVGSGATVKATALPFFLMVKKKNSEKFLLGAICIECQREQKSSICNDLARKYLLPKLLVLHQFCHVCVY